jgi:uncharacterized membrane protein YdbT with pleckstrin-like domain
MSSTSVLSERRYRSPVPYPDRILADDEEVVEHLHPHWITLLPATLWFLLVCLLAGAGFTALPAGGTARIAALIAEIVVAVLLVAWLSLAPWIRWRSTHYVFTTRRVLIRRGALRHIGRDIPLHRINDVGFEQSLFDRIVHAGTLTIESAGERGQEVLRDIPDSEFQQRLLNRLIEDDRRRGGGSWSRADWSSSYRG